MSIAYYSSYTFGCYTVLKNSLSVNLLRKGLLNTYVTLRGLQKCTPFFDTPVRDRGIKSEHVAWENEDEAKDGVSWKEDANKR